MDRFRIPDAAIANARKYGGALVGLPAGQGAPMSVMSDGFDRWQRFLATQVDFRGLLWSPIGVSLAGRHWAVEVGFDFGEMNDWSERKIDFLYSWWDRHFRKDQRWIYLLERVG